MTRALPRGQAILLGLVAAVGLCLGGAGIYAVGSRNWPGSGAFHVKVGFDGIRGVEVGTRVRIQGIDAGEVVAIEPPTTAGEPVLLRLRLKGDLRRLVLAGSTVQIVSEGLIGGKALEIRSDNIKPDTPDASPVADGAILRAQPAAELADVLGEVNSTLRALRAGEGTLGKLATDRKAYEALVTLLEQSKETMAAFQQDAEAMKRLPLVGRYVEDPVALLVRPRAERNRQVFAEEELFEPGRAALTARGTERLDALGPWLEGLKHKGSEIVVVAYADSKTANAQTARTLTREQSEAVVEYLKRKHAAHKLGLFTTRKVLPLGQGTSAPPVAESEPLPPARVEVLVFVPQG